MTKKPIQADSISIGVCPGCGSVHIYFHDEEENVVAEACLGPQNAIDLSEDLVEACGKGLDVAESGECAGHA